MTDSDNVHNHLYKLFIAQFEPIQWSCRYTGGPNCECGRILEEWASKIKRIKTTK